MRDQRTYNRCATRGCPFLLPAPLTYCRDHADDAAASRSDGFLSFHPTADIRSTVLMVTFDPRGTS